MTSEQITMRVSATMTNKGPQQINCVRLMSWPQLHGEFPPNIPSEGVVKHNRFASKAAVFYSGPKNSVGKFPNAWVLAWDAPGISTGGAPNKMYVKCGTKYAIDQLTEADILKCLEESSAEANYVDQATNTFVNASIDSVGCVAPFVGAVTANFGTTV